MIAPPVASLLAATNVRAIRPPVNRGAFNLNPATIRDGRAGDPEHPRSQPQARPNKHFRAFPELAFACAGAHVLSSNQFLKEILE